ncbi:hypothetical protein [Burkholderia gladioli]|uniref:hypothetical protein n=1 Tax=Burkholderia gladioli TaxID=28095 RepID=UPI001C5D6BEC|nr:hypothetical protein [Burkholderia gladioli]MBW5286799.1 hypothetical protein [Burkholderia gladioli]
MNNPDRGTGLGRHLARRIRRVKGQRDTTVSKKRFSPDLDQPVLIFKSKVLARGKSWQVVKDVYRAILERQVHETDERLANLEAQVANFKRFGVLHVLPAGTVEVQSPPAVEAPATRRQLSGPLDPSQMTLDYSEPSEQSARAREELYARFAVSPRR